MRRILFFLLLLLPISESYAESLDDLAENILQRISEHEGPNDATCWTTVRMMESFSAGKDISFEASLLKIEALKTLTYKLWRNSSAVSSSCLVRREDILASLSPEVRELLSNTDDTQLSISQHDYERITEGYRTLLSITQDALTNSGIFSGKREIDIAPLDTEARELFAKLISRLSLALLKRAEDFTVKHASPTIGINEIKESYRHFSSLILEKSQTSACSQQKSSVNAIQLTKQNIKNKIAALKTRNSEVWKTVPDDEYAPLKLLNRLARVEINAKQYLLIKKRLKESIRFLLRGGEPMRSDTNIPFGALTLEHSGPDRSAPLDLVTVSNAIRNIFPVTTHRNGDVEIVLTPSPSSANFKGKENAPKTNRVVTLQAQYLDSVRDTTIHWQLLDELYSEPEIKSALDPFAAEFLAERISEMVFYLMQAYELFPRPDWLVDETGVPVFTMFVDDFLYIPALRESPAPNNWDGPKKWLKAEKRLFADVTPKSGLDSVLCKNPLSKYEPTMHLYMGAGVTAEDYNNDGLVDVFLPGEGCNRLYKNTGDFRFADVTKEIGLENQSYDSRQAIFADINNNGEQDLFVIHSNSPSRLYRQKDGKFLEITESSGISSGVGAHSGFFFDYNNDGLLDLYVLHYGNELPNMAGRNGEKNQLYKNNGNYTFTPVSSKALVDSPAWSLAGTAFDANGDGYQDFFLANDFGHDELFLNNQDGTFREVAEEYGVADRGSGMNATVTDINYDGKPDLFVTVIEMFTRSLRFTLPTRETLLPLDDRILRSSFYLAGNQLFVQGENTNEFSQARDNYLQPGDMGWGWSANFFDYDNDGDLDLYIANGWIPRSLATDQRNILYLREGDKLQRVDPRKDDPAFLPSNSRAVAQADFDNDGFTDLLVTNYESWPKLLRNNSKRAKQSSIRVKLIGEESNRSAIGATIALSSPGIPKQRKYITAGGNYLSQSPALQSFTVKDADATFEITWPNGEKQKLSGVYKNGAYIEIKENT